MPRTIKKPSQPFHNQKSGQKSRNKKLLRDLVKNKFGNDIPSVIDFLRKEKSNDDNLRDNDHFSAIVGLNEMRKYFRSFTFLYRKNKITRNKRVYLSVLRDMGLTKKDANNLGFACGDKAWKKAGEHLKNYTPGEFYPLTHKKKITDQLLQQIKEFLFDETISYEAANRTVKRSFIMTNATGENARQTVLTPVRYLNQSILRTYTLFKGHLARGGYASISESLFRTALKHWKEFKLPRKQSDVCHFCLRGKRITERLRNRRATLHSQCRDCTQDSDCPQESQRIDIARDEEIIQAYHKHREHKKAQRDSYKEQIVHCFIIVLILFYYVSHFNLSFQE